MFRELKTLKKRIDFIEKRLIALEREVHRYTRFEIRQPESNEKILKDLEQLAIKILKVYALDNDTRFDMTDVSILDKTMEYIKELNE